ncbi:MAG: Plug and carboxypeptidase regulatory-like domain-containing protein, partial [Longimicrobiales bacterium]|nr:Plug and carboxypeptidase regulatory-like domain-containing protein [Longimicrobiales bacterium]
MTRRRRSRVAWCSLALRSLVVLVVPGDMVAQSDQPAQSVVSAELNGVVRARFGARLDPLHDALVELTTVEGRYTTRSDSDGRYALVGLPGGAARLRVTRVGHAPLDLTVRLPSTGTLDLDLELTATPMLLPGVRVEARGESDASAPDDQNVPAPDPLFELRRLELSPGVVESGVVDAVMGMSGNEPADPSDVLFMRGSTTDLKLVLLDGVPVYAPFHVGGLLKSFEPSRLASADFHVGGAPARYDGGLTHILDLETRTARRDRTRASATVDLLSSAVVLEQPLGDRAGVLVSARSLHDAGTRVLGGGSSPYGYSDVLGTLNADVGTAGSIRLTGFRNQESVVLDYPDGPGDARWGNRAITGTWRHQVGSAELQATVGASRYDARLPLQSTSTDDDPTPSTIVASAENARARVVLESGWRNRGLPIRAGLSFENQTLAYEADRLDESSRLRRGGARSVVGGYVDGSYTVFPGVTVRTGLRGDV